jgi:hypothetical protein
MKPEAQHIQETIAQYQEAMIALPAQYTSAKRDNARKIDLLCEEAGIMGKIEELRTQLEATQKKLQSQADMINGHVQALKEIHRLYHLAPIPEGITHMYGIELEPLEPDTRLIVMHGQESPAWHETIGALGGDATRKEWDGTPKEEDFVVEPEEPAGLIPHVASWATPEEEEEEEEEEEDDETGDPEFMDEDTGESDPNLDAIRNMMS